LAAWRFLPRNDTSDRPVIAVLPFAQYSGAPDDAALAARLTDGVTAELARKGALDVVSHTSALKFACARAPLRDVARTLGATVVVEATLLREGDGVRVQARLVDAVRDRKVWVEDFVGSETEARELQERMAAAVVSAALRPRRR